jgi:hypothetical protein
VVYLKVLAKHLPGGTGEDHEEASLTDAWFETVTLQTDVFVSEILALVPCAGWFS